MVRPSLRPVALAVAALALPAALVAAPASGSTAARATDAPAGRKSAGMVLDQQGTAQFYGYDALVDSDGTTYLAWIASHTGADRTVYLCPVPKGGSTCTVQPVSSLGGSSAEGLRLLKGGGKLSAVWFHAASGQGKLAVADIVGGVMQSPTDKATLDANGGMYDATMSPTGAIWALTWDNAIDKVQIHPGLGNAPTTLDPSFFVNTARIAFDHDQGVLALGDTNVGTPIRISSQQSNGTWRALTNVPKAWNLSGDFDLVRGRASTVRLVSSVPNANYYPQVAAWTGTAFGAFRRTGYAGGCEWNTHDLYADASGRIADASFSCDTVRISNQPAGGAGRLATWSDGHTPIGGNAFADNGPQIATSPRGTGWLMYARESSTPGASNQLVAVPVRLPALPRSVAKATTGGRAIVTGPTSCMPAVDMTVSLVGRPASGWKVISKSLTRNGAAQGSLLHGEKLAAGSTQTLTGKVVFGKGTSRTTSIAKLPFSACPGPTAF